VGSLSVQHVSAFGLKIALLNLGANGSQLIVGPVFDCVLDFKCTAQHILDTAGQTLVDEAIRGQEGCSIPLA
jgi:hypothetical protein